MIFTFNAFALYRVNSLPLQYCFLTALNALLIFFLSIGNENAIAIPLLLLTYICNANIFSGKLTFLPLLSSPITSSILTIALAPIIFRALSVNVFILLILPFLLRCTSNYGSGLGGEYTSPILAGSAIGEAAYMFNTVMA